MPQIRILIHPGMRAGNNYLTWLLYAMEFYYYYYIRTTIVLRAAMTRT